MHCKQSGHLARNYPKQVARNLPTTKACRALIDFFFPLPESSKNKTLVFPVPRGTIAFLSPKNPY